MEMERRTFGGGSSSSMSHSPGSSGEPEIVVEAAPSSCNKVFVALPAQFRAGMPVLSWALKHVDPQDAMIILTHVHVPPQMIPCMGTKFHASKVRAEEVNAYRQIERTKVDKQLDQYLCRCSEMKVKAEKLVLENEDVVNGLIELISVHGITKFVMGAAVDKRYSKFRRIKAPKSKKAIAVMQKADLQCKIWFVCNEKLICIRDEESQGGPADVPPVHESDEDLPVSLPCQGLVPTLLGDISLDVDLYDKLQEAFTKADNSMRKAYSDESCMRQNPQENLVSWPHKFKELANLYLSEVQRRKQSDETRARAHKDVQLQKQTVDLLRSQQDETISKLQEANEQKLLLEQRIADSNRAMKDLQDELAAAKFLVKSQQAEYKELKRERDDAAREVQGLLDQRKVLEQWIADSDRATKALEDDLATAKYLLDLQQAEWNELQRERDNAVSELEEFRNQRRLMGKTPSYFICPISQEVMMDPQITADGFTYEAEAIKGWLSRGHNTSPMTNLTLAHHNLIPNHALRSAIQEYLQHKKTQLS